MHLCNRVDRRSKSQNISELAFSLNRYHNSATPLFYSETQSDISFLIILCKDSHTHAKKANFSAFSYMKPLFFQLPSAQPSHFLGMHRRFFRLHFLFPYLHFFLPARYFLLSEQKKFVTKFVIHVTNFLTHVTNFVIYVTNFVTKNFL